MGQDQRPEPADPGVFELGGDPVAGGAGVDEDGGRAAGWSRIESPWPTSSIETLRPVTGAALPSPPLVPEERPEEESDGADGDCRPQPDPATFARRAAAARRLRACDPPPSAEPVDRQRAGDDRRVGAEEAGQADPDLEVGPARPAAPGRDLGDVGEQGRVEGVDRRDREARHLPIAAASMPSHIAGATAGSASRFAARVVVETAPKWKAIRGAVASVAEIVSAAPSASVPAMPRDRSAPRSPPQRRGESRIPTTAAKLSCQPTSARSRLERERDDRRHRQPVEARGAAPGRVARTVSAPITPARWIEGPAPASGT